MPIVFSSFSLPGGGACCEVCTATVNTDYMIVMLVLSYCVASCIENSSKFVTCLLITRVSNFLSAYLLCTVTIEFDILLKACNCWCFCRCNVKTLCVSAKVL